MKFIFDFDSVLFDTKQFIKHIYACLEKVGISQKTAEEYYKETRGKEFSLKNFVTNLIERNKVNQNWQNVYEEIMTKSKSYVNNQLVEIVKSLGKQNCYIVTNGDQEFQQDKIKRSGVAPLFQEIYVVPGSKKEVIEKICAKDKSEKIIFIDDKVKFFEDLDMAKFPNLQTILYDEKGFEKVLSILP